MSPFRTILFPVDFSAANADTVPYVNEMAQRFNASVIVLHVFDLRADNIWISRDEMIDEPGEVDIPYTPAFEKLRDERQRRLEQFVRDHFPNIHCVTSIEDGDAATVITAVAETKNADLIVMPTRGLGTFRRLLLGSVTAKVLHDVSIPVLTSAHQPAAAAPTRGYSSILCAVEANAEADAVLEAASFLAQTYDAKLCLAHVASKSLLEGAQSSSAESMLQTFQRSLKRDAGTRELNVRILMLDGGLTEGIRNTAIEEKADLVVVGRGHARGNLSRIWSHLYTIIRESPCPVLSV